MRRKSWTSGVRRWSAGNQEPQDQNLGASLILDQKNLVGREEDRWDASRVPSALHSIEFSKGALRNLILEIKFPAIKRSRPAGSRAKTIDPIYCNDFKCESTFAVNFAVNGSEGRRTESRAEVRARRRRPAVRRVGLAGEHQKATLASETPFVNSSLARSLAC